MCGENKVILNRNRKPFGQCILVVYANELCKVCSTVVYASELCKQSAKSVRGNGLFRRRVYVVSSFMARRGQARYLSRFFVGKIAGRIVVNRGENRRKIVSEIVRIRLSRVGVSDTPTSMKLKILANRV